MIPPEWAVVFMVGYAAGSLVVFCIVLCHAPRKPPELEAAERERDEAVKHMATHAGLCRKCDSLSAAFLAPKEKA